MMPTEEQKRRCRDRSLRAKYNITIEEWEKIFEVQGKVCAICKRGPECFKNTMSLDHDHGSRLCRGILCWGCNSLLPARRELVDRLIGAVEYLKNPPAVAALGGPRYANAMKRRRKKR